MNVTTDDLALLGAYLETLKKHGVSSISGLDLKGVGFCSLEFFPPTAPVETGAVIPRAMTLGTPEEPDSCPCGHDVTTHDGHGLCLLGCAEEVCFKKPKEP